MDNQNWIERNKEAGLTISNHDSETRAFLLTGFRFCRAYAQVEVNSMALPQLVILSSTGDAAYAEQEAGKRERDQMNKENIVSSDEQVYYVF